MGANAAPVPLDALGPSGAYRARNRVPIADVASAPVAELSLVPKLFVVRAMAALHRARTLPLGERLRILANAGELYASGAVDGTAVDEYQRMVSRVSGTPISVVRAATELIARHARDAYRWNLESARPTGVAAVNDWRPAPVDAGSAVWVRRGNVFAAHTPGNHPGVQAVWLEALALGYRVAVRPSRREPFTAHRLASALRAAGLGTDQLTLLPTEHDVADEIVRGADLAVAYGGEDVVRKYGSTPTVLAQGPGRSKILVTSDVDWREHLGVIVDSIAHGGGTGCVNVTGVLVEGDPSPLAEAIAAELALLPSLPPEDDDCVLPVHSLESAQQIERHLLRRAGAAISWLGGSGIVDELGDGSAALRPAVHELDRATDERLRVEMPFPCAWVAPWMRQDGIKPLRDTLVLTALTHDDDLLDQLLQEPTICNVYIGSHPTYSGEPGVSGDPIMPHDGYLSDFLMRTKGVIRGATGEVRYDGQP